MRYYAAVWVDFLHHVYEGKVALNVQECTKKGQPIETHRKHCEAARFFADEKWIVDEVLPGAVHYTKAP